MTAQDPGSDHLAELLQNAYAAIPDARFAEGLLRQLTGELSAPRKNWQPRWRIALAASVAALCIVSAVLDWESHLARLAAPNATYPLPAANKPVVISPSTTQHLTERTMTLGMLGVADRVGTAPLIVRVRLLHWDAPFVQYTISYVIYGNCSDKTVTIDMSGEIQATQQSARDRLKSKTGKEPAEADVNAEVMKSMGIEPDCDMILELRPFPNHPQAAHGVKYLCDGIAFDVPPEHSLNDWEDQIINTIADGSAFKPNPQPGDVLIQRMADVQLIVRAQLVEVGAGQSKWKIIRVLKGDAKPETLILDDQFFHQRAEAIVAHVLRKQSKPAATQPTASLIDAETDRLIKAELTLPKEAILFVDQVQATPDSIHGRLRDRAYEDQQKPKLDKLQDAILHPDGAIQL